MNAFTIAEAVAISSFVSVVLFLAMDAPIREIIEITGKCYSFWLRDGPLAMAI